MLPRMVLPEDLADALGVTARTVRRWAKAGKLPTAVFLGGRLYFDPIATRAWLHSRRRRNHTLRAIWEEA